MQTFQPKHAEIDLEWDDDHVLPEVINPEVAFLFRRMIEVTHAIIDPRKGELILDVGCGKATDGVSVSQRGATVIGLEPSNVMVTCSMKHIAQNNANMALVHAIGENLPFKLGAFDKVYCKGSLDHFPNPSVALAQMNLAAKPTGTVIIAIANFESLGFKLGKAVCWLKGALGFGKVEGKMVWDIPDDHTYRFTCANLKEMAGQHMEIKSIRGVSLLFGVPWWGSFLNKCPQRESDAILDMLDRVARYAPSLSDVVIVSCRPKSPAS